MGLTGVPKDTVYPHRLYRLATAVFFPKSRLTENPVTRMEFLGTQTVFSVSQGIMTVLVGGVVRFLPRTRWGVGFFRAVITAKRGTVRCVCDFLSD